MFNDLSYCNRVKHVVLKISQDEVIIAKWSKICGVHILEGSNIVVHSLSASEDFHDKNKLWDLRSRHDDCLKAVSKHFNEFCKR